MKSVNVEFSIEERELQREAAELLKTERYKRVIAWMAEDTSFLSGATASEQAVFEKGARSKLTGLHWLADLWRERPPEEHGDG